MARLPSVTLLSAFAMMLGAWGVIFGCGDNATEGASNHAGASGSGVTGGSGGDAQVTGGQAGSSGTDAGSWPSGGSGGGDAGTAGSSGGAGTAGATGGTGGATGGTGGSSSVDCSGIQAHPDFELCGSGADYCEGVFTNYNGCVAFCAAAGLTCSERYGGEPGCQGPELNYPLNCGDNTGHQSDWCRCAASGSAGTGGSGGTGGSPGCPTEAGNPPTARSLNFKTAVYTNRPAWVLECRDYAYTALYAEHEACDPLYKAGSASGTATFTFHNVPTGMYNVYFQGRHTASRNPQGALVIVSSGGQSWSQRIMQRDDSNSYPKDLHGTYCLSGTVTVLLDSTTSASDSVQNVYLEP